MQPVHQWMQICRSNLDFIPFSCAASASMYDSIERRKLDPLHSPEYVLDISKADLFFYIHMIWNTILVVHCKIQIINIFKPSKGVESLFAPL